MTKPGSSGGLALEKIGITPTNAETKKSQLYIQVPCYRSLYLLRMHTELTLPGEEDIYFGLDKHKHKRGELLVVEEGKGGSFTCVGGGKVGRGVFSLLWTLLRARLYCSFIGLCL